MGSKAIHSDTVEVIATRRQLSFYCDQEGYEGDQVDRFQIDKVFLQTYNFVINDGILEIKVSFGEDETFFINNKDYDPFILQEWSLAVLQTSLDACIADQLRIPPPVQALVKRGGGAPLKYDWAGAGAAVAAYVVDNDYPEDHLVLREYVKSWFGTKGLSPDNRDIIRFVQTIYQEGRRLKDGRKTSFPEFSASPK